MSRIVFITVIWCRITGEDLPLYLSVDAFLGQEASMHSIAGNVNEHCVWQRPMFFIFIYFDDIIWITCWLLIIPYLDWYARHSIYSGKIRMTKHFLYLKKLCAQFMVILLFTKLPVDIVFMTRGQPCFVWMVVMWYAYGFMGHIPWDHPICLLSPAGNRRNTVRQTVYVGE